jgi:polyisoprenoid-binding protein YceI
MAARVGTLDRESTKGEVMTTTPIEQTTTRWTVDPEETHVEFDVKTFWGLATVHGRFDRFTGSYETGSDEASIELVIDADSLDTGNGTRDGHLRSGGFFDAAEHPQLRFTSSRVHEVAEGVLHVGGHLEAAGRSEWLEFPAIVRPVGDGLEIDATTTVDQQELGMSDGPLGMIRRPATLRVTARLIETTSEER